MSSPTIQYTQASPEQIVRAAEVCYRIYKDSPIKRAFASPEMVLSRWRWVVEGNPTRSPFGPPAWVALRGDEVVGHFGVIPATAVVGDRMINVAWGRDFFVDASVRGAGVGSSLVETAVRKTGTVLVAGLNPRAIRAYRRVGFILRGAIPFYLKVLRAADLAPAIHAGRLPSWITRAAAEAAALWGRSRGGGNRRVRVTDAFDDRFDRWWSAVERSRGCLIQRSSATMNWRYRDSPSHRYAVLEFERDGELRGSAVVRSGVSRGMSAGMLVELLVERADHEAARELISAAEAYLRETGPDHALIRSNTFGRDVGIALLAAGFVPAPSPFRWMIANPGLLGDDGRDCAFFLNGGDSDMDFI